MKIMANSGRGFADTQVDGLNIAAEPQGRELPGRMSLACRSKVAAHGGTVTHKRSGIKLM